MKNHYIDNLVSNLSEEPTTLVQNQLLDDSRIMILSPLINEKKGEHLHVFQDLLSQGFIRARIDGIITDLDDSPSLEKNKKHTTR